MIGEREREGYRKEKGRDERKREGRLRGKRKAMMREREREE
jgi:hypothetical protein